MDPPVPIPNTVVKHSQADGTWLETTWESRMLPVRVKALRMQCFFLSAYMCAIVTVQKYLDGGQYAGGILPGNIQIDQLDISATGLGEQYANGILRETSSNEYRTCFAVRCCQLEKSCFLGNGSFLNL